MKIIKLLLISLIVLSCSNDNDEPNYLAATEYGIYVKGIDSEYDYEFYNFNSGEIYHEGTTNDSFLYFDVTSKERSNTHIIAVVSCIDPNIEVFSVIRNGDFYLNDKDNPSSTSVYELNTSVKISVNKFECILPIEKYNVNKWIKYSEY